MRNGLGLDRTSVMPNPFILIIGAESEDSLARLTMFHSRGYEVGSVPGVERALEAIHQQAPDLIIIELDSKAASPLQDCKSLRDSTAAPILAISSVASEQYKIEALSCCVDVDDYVTQPFGIEELLARIRALLRRSGTAEQESSILCAGGITIRTGEHRVEIGGREIKLTPKEFDVLAYLVANSGKVVTHRSLLQAVWGEQASEQDEYLRVLINRLRRKIEPVPRRPRYIVTEPWVGYRFQPGEK
jgi:two-component system KDP operon response regulator KdpE